MDQTKLDEAVSEVVRSIHYATQQEIRSKRLLLKDIEKIRKKYGWKFYQEKRS